MPGKRLRPRGGGRGRDVEWGSVSGGDDIPCGRPSSCHRQRRGRPQGSPPLPSPPPPLRGRGTFPPKNLPVRSPTPDPGTRAACSAECAHKAEKASHRSLDHLPHKDDFHVLLKSPLFV